MTTITAMTMRRMKMTAPRIPPKVALFSVSACEENSAFDGFKSSPVDSTEHFRALKQSFDNHN